MIGDDSMIDEGGRDGDRSARCAAASTPASTSQIRSGGPAIGFQTVTSQMYNDDDILLGYVYTDEGDPELRASSRPSPS